MAASIAEAVVAAKGKNGKVKDAVVTPHEESAPKKLFLSTEERLELHNLNLRQQIMEVQVQQQITGIEREQAKLIHRINTRLSDDIGDYKINLHTGECEYDAQAATRNAQAKAKARQEAPNA